MTIFALILDLAFSNGYAIGCTLSTQYKCSVQFDKFKLLCTAEQLTRPWHKERSEKASIRKCKQEVQQSPSVPPASLQTHVLSDNTEGNDDTKSAHLRKDSKCYLCALVGQGVTGMKTATSKLGCFQCGHCYHLHYFNVFHHHHVNMNKFNAWLDLAVISSKLRKRCCFVMLEPTGGALTASGASN
jgi:hypothetical protein